MVAPYGCKTLNPGPSRRDDFDRDAAPPINTRTSRAGIINIGERPALPHGTASPQPRIRGGRRVSRRD